MPTEELLTLAQNAAKHHGLFPELVCAIVEQESSWDTTATRFEPAFKSRYIAKLSLGEPEATLRATSFGLMQLMGQVAREQGYIGDLFKLCDPATGLEWGCKYFANRMAHAEDSVTKALLLWNGGGNQAYPAQVLSRVKNYKGSMEDGQAPRPL